MQPRSFPGLPDGWVAEWETFPSDDGLTLFASHFHARDRKPRRALVVLHGQGEHGGRYLHFPHFLKDDVDAVYCPDLRGHGRSEGLRGHVERFDQYCEDSVVAIKRFHQNAQKNGGEPELHLMGHSMGGLIALRLLFLHADLPIRSCTLSAPLLGLKLPVPIVKKAAARIVALAWGRLQMTNEIDASMVSHDPEVVEAYMRDRLVHNKLTPRFFFSLEDAMADTRARDSGLTCPLQILVPLEDRLVDPEASLSFFRHLKHRDKRLKTYPGFYHESFNELGKEKAFEDLRSWIRMQK